MKLKVAPLYILSFLILVFLVQEIHDWVHVLLVRATSHCWPDRLFGSWDFCGQSSYSKHALVLLGAPLVNFTLLWIGWSLLHPEGTVEENSLGVAFVFATLPFNSLLAAFHGGGDLTDSLRWMQQHGFYSNVHFASRLGLVLALLILVPPLVRAFLRLPGYKGRLIVFPLMLVAPGWLDPLWNAQLNRWFLPPGTSQGHAYAVVLAWLLLLVIGLLFTRKKLMGLIEELTL